MSNCLKSLLVTALLTLAASGCSDNGLLPGSTPTQPPTAPPTESPTATPTEEPAPEACSLGETQVRPADGMAMVCVPSGEFPMGRTIRPGREHAHTVSLDTFWIDQTEVTNGQYAQCVAAGACDPPRASDSYTRDSYYGNITCDDYPVIYVTWYSATTYCEWAGGRLPTEAEWEYAARGPEGYEYPWGNVLDGTRLNYCNTDCDLDWREAAHADTAPVGSYTTGASWVGALDMSGNVREWVADWYGDYPYRRQENPTGPTSGDFRVVRGGSWRLSDWEARCGSRYWWLPSRSHLDLGFRCVSPVASSDR